MCHQVDGAGVGANLQEVRRQVHAGAAKLVASQWVLVEVWERDNDTGELWLKRTMATGEWSGACARKEDKNISAGKTWMKNHRICWNCGGYMVAVQWYELVSDSGHGVCACLLSLQMVRLL
jgi:hypothetical protein